MSSRDLGQVGTRGTNAFEPPIDMADHDQPVTLVAVARTVSQHEILDCVVRPAGPRKHMVDLCWTGPKRAFAVEAAIVLGISKKVAQPVRERSSVSAEEMPPQVDLFHVEVGPLRHLSHPVHLDERPNERSETKEFVRRPGHKGEHTGLAVELSPCHSF